ncbi:MAG: type III-A CRISPR-associated protein Csm2 [Acidobacteria bacterium]|jgi:CRISPR type III-A-associated protein Csm2|nr:MAG: type III-A CRISPR-associated protein Csm2 [Acidobacteriota bacterium]
MPEEVQPEATQTDAPPKQEPAKPEPPKAEPQKHEAQKPSQAPRREDRQPRPGGENRGENRGERRGDRPERGRDDRRGDRRDAGPRPGGRPFEGPPEIELEKLITDSLYLDNQAHAVVARMRDMDSGTKSQLRRLYNAVRRAVRAPESERQHQFVMLRARLAYTTARHSLRSLDALERLLLQVTRKNDARGYERFKDLFEAIVAYNE